MQSLVGYTGFVGHNIAIKHLFDGLYNSKNIGIAYNTNPNLLVYSGIRAEKFLANQNAKADMDTIENAIENIKKINPKKIVLISTVDVYKNPVNVDEDTVSDFKNLQPYGLHRYYLEKWVEDNIDDYLIVRLPGLYGANIKKNFIFDMINRIPSLLNKQKYQELASKSEIIAKSYCLQENGFYRYISLSPGEAALLKKEFLVLGFSALNFTDSRGIFQFYPLSYLWKHIQIALENNINKLNLAVEPVAVAELYHYIYDCDFLNEITLNRPYYNYQTKHANLFAGEGRYIFNKSFIMQDIKHFVEAFR